MLRFTGAPVSASACTDTAPTPRAFVYVAACVVYYLSETMKAVGAFNADFVQVILLVNTRYLVLMDLPLAKLQLHLVYDISFLS